MQEFEAELEAVGAERAEQEAQAAEAALDEAERELQQLRAAADELAAQERHYWHAFNDFHLQLAVHVEERDALLTKVGRALRPVECSWTCCCHTAQCACIAVSNACCY